MKIPAILLVVLLLTSGVFSQKLEVGQVFPLEELKHRPRNEIDQTIVVFIPNLTYETEYASMLTQSLHYYFIEKLAFSEFSRKPDIRVVLIVNDSEAKKTENLPGILNLGFKETNVFDSRNIISGMDVIYDESGKLFSRFGQKVSNYRNADSSLFLIDKKGVIQFYDQQYRSQGEHLKPLEKKVFEIAGMKMVETGSASKPLIIGMKAPDFTVTKGTKLSDLRGRIALISFYPAAFSGTFSNSSLEIIGDVMSCSMQIIDLDDSKKTAPDHITIAVTSSTPQLLEKWRKVLATKSILYANDPEYMISRAYGALNSMGYNDRVSIIVDRKGKIAFIDTSFEKGDDAILSAKIDEIALRK